HRRPRELRGADAHRDAFGARGRARHRQPGIPLRADHQRSHAMIRAALLLLALLIVSDPARSEEAALPPDSIYHLDARLSDQTGREFTLAQRRGKVQLVAMFYTSCRYVCPLIVDSAKGVEHALNADEREQLHVLLVSL